MLDLDTLPLSRKQMRSIVQSRAARISIWAGAVRSGKTVSSLVAFLMAVAEAPSSGLILITGRTLQTIERNIFDPLQDPVLFGELAAQVHHTPGSSTATILGRTVHLIGSADVRAEARLRGLTACLALADEVTLMSQSFWTQLLARLSVPGARLLATTNPDNPAHWLRKDFILREADLDLRHWHFTLDDNPSLTAKYKADLAAENTGLWYKRRVLGQWVAAEGAIYDMWDADVHVVDILPPITDWIGVGIDYGTTAAFAALMLGLGTRGGGPDGSRPCLYLVDEWRWDSRVKHRQLSDAEYSQHVRQWVTTVRFPGTQLTGPAPRYWVVDPSAASFRVQLHNDGVTTVGADNEVLDGIRGVASLLAQRRLKVSRSCQGFIDEIGGYSWDDKAALKGEDKPVKVDDHSLDASRYILRTTESVWRHAIPFAA